MRMFDTVVFHCPTPGCWERIEVQSKAGDCLLRELEPGAVPISIAVDIVGDLVHCWRCRVSYTVSRARPEPETIALELVL